MTEAVIRLLETTGFYSNEPDRWWLSPEPRTHRYLIFWIERDGELPVFCLSVEEWRGGEGYEDTVFRSESQSETLAAIEHWVAWAREPFVRTRWQKLRDRFLGRHWLD